MRLRCAAGSCQPDFLDPYPCGGRQVRPMPLVSHINRISVAYKDMHLSGVGTMLLCSRLAEQARCSILTSFVYKTLVCCRYILIVLMADDHGEGGLHGLAHSSTHIAQ